MNLLRESDFSLYQIVQRIQPSLQPIIVSTPILKFLAGSLLDILTQQQIKADIWVKLPQTKSWLNQLERYIDEGNAEKIYWCDFKKERQTLSLQERTPLAKKKFQTKIIPVELKTSSILKKESFLLVVAADFCFLLVAQWQTGKVQIEASSKRLQQPYLKTLFTFDSETILNTLTAIQDSIESKSICSEAKLPSPVNTPTETQFLVSLAIAQIQQIEKIQAADRLENLETKIVHFRENKTFGNEFLNNLVRELRSPLTQVKTALSLLESKQLKGEQRQRYLQLINRECDRQNSLISGLLELMELDSFSESDIVAAVKLEDLVPGIVSTYQPLAEEKGIQLGYTIPTGFPPISCPPGWLRQIIINLLNNSLQFTSSGGKVFVQASLRDDQIELIVSDTGSGIDSKELGKIFNSFYRGRTAINEQVSGAGLGLTIVQQLIRRCGGSISVNSKVGKGSSFRILLPVIPPELSEQES
jgi:signal transduction histidine kinase